MVFDLDAEKINPLMALSPPDCEPTPLSLRVKAPSVFTFNVRKARLTLPEISGNPAPLCAPATKLSPSAQFRKNLWPLRNYRPELDFWRCQQSFRNWAPGSGKVSGAWSPDSGRNLTGQVDYLLGTTSGGIPSGCFAGTTQRPPVAVAEGQTHHQIVLNFDAATVWGEHAGAEFVPPHVWQPAILYLGRPA